MTLRKQSAELINEVILNATPEELDYILRKSSAMNLRALKAGAKQFFNIKRSPVLQKMGVFGKSDPVRKSINRHARKVYKKAIPTIQGIDLRKIPYPTSGGPGFSAITQRPVAQAAQAAFNPAYAGMAAVGTAAGVGGYAFGKHRENQRIKNQPIWNRMFMK